MDRARRMVGYCRVSTERQARGRSATRAASAGRQGLGLEVQERAIRAAAEREGWELVSLEVDAGVSARARRRPALERALTAVRAGEADGLVVAKLDRLARSVLDFSRLLAEADRRGWELVALDVGVDTTTATGRMVAHILAALGEWEREVISSRTREAMGEARERGVELGRRSTLPAEVVERVVREKAAGGTLAGIARQLEAEGIPAGAGGRWYPATVARVLKRAQVPA